MKKRYAIVPWFLALGLVGGCDEAPDEASEVQPGPEQEEPDGSRSLDSACAQKYDNLGRRVLAEFSACDDDADCTLSDGAAGCLSPFLCSPPIAHRNEAAYTEASLWVVEEYLAECGNFCTIADCASPEQLRAVCDTSIGQCTTEYLTPLAPVSE